MIKTILTAATLALSPLAALAATISVSSNFDTATTATLNPLNSPYTINIDTDTDTGAFSQDYVFTASEAIRITTTATANRFAAFTDQGVFWSSNPSDMLNGFSSSDELVIDMKAGDQLTLTIEWDSVARNDQVFDVVLTVDSVPLPAGVVLMGSALAGLGLARRRKG